MWSYFILLIILTKAAAQPFSPCGCYQTSIFDDNDQFLIQPGENGYVDGEDTYKYCYVYQMEQMVAGYGATACQGILESISLGVCSDPSHDLDALVASSTGCISLNKHYDPVLDLYGLKCKLDVNYVCNMNNEGNNCENDNECASSCMQCCTKRKKCELKPQRESITICLTVPFNNNEYFNYVGYYQDNGDKFKCGQISDGYPHDNKGLPHLPDLCSTTIPTTTTVQTTAIQTTTQSYSPCDCYWTLIFDDNDKYLIQAGENGYVDGEDRYKYCYTYQMMQKVAGYYTPVSQGNEVNVISAL
eukprot:440696_1